MMIEFLMLACTLLAALAALGSVRSFRAAMPPMPSGTYLPLKITASVSHLAEWHRKNRRRGKGGGVNLKESVPFHSSVNSDWQKLNSANVIAFQELFCSPGHNGARLPVFDPANIQSEQSARINPQIDYLPKLAKLV